MATQPADDDTLVTRPDGQYHLEDTLSGIEVDGETPIRASHVNVYRVSEDLLEGILLDMDTPHDTSLLKNMVIAAQRAFFMDGKGARGEDRPFGVRTYLAKEYGYDRAEMDLADHYTRLSRSLATNLTRLEDAVITNEAGGEINLSFAERAKFAIYADVFGIDELTNLLANGHGCATLDEFSSKMVERTGIRDDVENIELTEADGNVLAVRPAGRIRYAAHYSNSVLEEHAELFGELATSPSNTPRVDETSQAVADGPDTGGEEHYVENHTKPLPGLWHYMKAPLAIGASIYAAFALIGGLFAWNVHEDSLRAHEQKVAEYRLAKAEYDHYLLAQAGDALDTVQARLDSLVAQVDLASRTAQDITGDIETLNSRVDEFTDRTVAKLEQVAEALAETSRDVERNLGRMDKLYHEITSVGADKHDKPIEYAVNKLGAPKLTSLLGAYQTAFEDNPHKPFGVKKTSKTAGWEAGDYAAEKGKQFLSSYEHYKSFTISTSQGMESTKKGASNLALLAQSFGQDQLDYLIEHTGITDANQLVSYLTQEHRRQAGENPDLEKVVITGSKRTVRIKASSLRDELNTYRLVLTTYGAA